MAMITNPVRRGKAASFPGNAKGRSKYHCIYSGKGISIWRISKIELELGREGVQHAALPSDICIGLQ